MCSWVQVLARACAPEKTQHTPEQAMVAERLVKELGPFADQENALDDLGCCNDVSPKFVNWMLEATLDASQSGVGMH